MRALVTGATGFVGRRLLEKLDRPVVLSRDASKAKQSLSQFKLDVFSWNPEKEPAPAEAFAGVDAVFHLAGDPVADGRWTAEKKKRLRDSRELGTRNLVTTLAQLEQKPKVLVSASAVGFYSDRGDELLDESASPGHDFLADLCRAWEHEAQKAIPLGVRTVNVRVGIVLEKNGGALKKMLPPFYMGVGSALGSGKQYMPWIHLDDLVQIFLYSAQHNQVRGPVNGVAPNPVTNREFTKSLGQAVHRPTFFPPVPGFMLKLMFGEFGDILLHSQRCQPKAIQAAGYQFRFPELDRALAAIFAKKPAHATLST